MCILRLMPTSAPSEPSPQSKIAPCCDRDRAPAFRRGTRSAPLILPRGSSQLFRTRGGDWLRKIEQSRVFALAKILSLEELGQADDVRAPACRLRNAIERLSQISAGLGPRDGLDAGDGELVSHLFSNLVPLNQSLLPWRLRSKPASLSADIFV